MGRIAPKKRKGPGDDARFSRAVWRHLYGALRGAPTALRTLWPWTKSSLTSLWHLPEHFAWMSPLPAFHRRWIAASAALLLAALLWPVSDGANLRSPLPINDEDVTPVPIQAELQEANRVPSDQAAWQEYLIQPGQTLAQVLREHRLDVTDAFAMARVEGEDRPLRNLRAGQHVLIRHNARGQIQALQIETPSGQKITFRRTPDGNFTRRP